MKKRMIKREFTKRVAEGKTKIICQSRRDPTECRNISKNDTTAGDGKRHEVIPGKGRLVNEVACNIFGLLHRHDIPTAYRRRYNDTSFIATLCRMVPLEIVVRFEVDVEGSYKKRNPDVPAGYRFPRPIVELFLKTTGRKWGDRDLPCDDPFLTRNLRSGGEWFCAYPPDVNPSRQGPLFYVSLKDLRLKQDSDIDVIESLAKRVGSVIGDAMASVGARIVDLKFEAGYTPAGDLVVADVISPDEWRCTTDIGKQGFRGGEPAEILLAKYQLALALSKHFPK